jgi:NAD(P)-dependent dehydrogenase (short-subunit alcohol dehydrogenase family)
MASQIPPEEIQRAVEILEAIVAERTLLSFVDPELRVRMLVAAGRVSRPTRDESIRTSKAFRRIDRKRTQQADRDARATTEIRAARRADVFAPPPQLLPGVSAPLPEETPELKKPRDCYVCKEEFTKLHFFYDALCPSCAAFNYDKRFQTASLEGRTALITGARVKIGFQAALMMLRAGAEVIVTTRFPVDAAARFAREADFSRWESRLAVHGLDLRHAPSVELFARYMVQTRDRLDILINNAAQTVRRPPAFYTHLLAAEQAPQSDLPDAVRRVLKNHETCKAALTLDLGEHGSSRDTTMRLVAFQGGEAGIGIRSSAAMSQLPCEYDDAGGGRQAFPLNATDADQQQVDLRSVNSWRLTLADVPSPEMLEVQLVNAVAPFILASKLKPLMLRHRTNEKHIVNVSAMEGQFSRRTKTDKHPHTNMAKAALNMMTLTSAPDYAADGIFMNAVDTGWVTDEDPAQLAARKTADHDFQPPLDIVDGAARICDPFFSGLLTGEHVFGKFLKDYRPASW